MNKFIKITVSAVLSVSMTLTMAYASILGTEQTHTQTEICNSAVLNKNVFKSDSVGNQTEYYCEYTPNANVRPVVVNGESIWGRRTVTQASQYMKDNGMTPLIGINADFFSLKTGVPMSHTIMNGEVVTKDSTGQDAIGFRADGTAFMSWLEIQTVLSTDDQSFYIDNVNKYRQPGAYPAFLLTDKFGADTKASTWGIDVVIGNINGSMKIGEAVTGVIEDIGYNDGAIAIPKGKMVLTMDCNGYPELYAQMQNLKIGQAVTITNNAVYDQALWQSAESAIGSIGGRLLNNGEIGSGFEAGTAPRTAVGITADGKVIFYVLDGRQSGYSYGSKIATLAQRMKELGCVDAINLDGGGSTSMAGVYPGSDTMSVINSPSDGSLRKVANFLFLQNMQQPTGTVGNLYVRPSYQYYLNGMTEQMSVIATDTANYNTQAPNDIQYSTYHTNSWIDGNGVITFSGEGEVIVSAYSPSTGVTGQTSLFTYSTPTDIKIKNQSTGKEIFSYTASAGSTIDLTAESYAGAYLLKSADNIYKWSVEGDIGTVDGNGVLTLSQNAGAKGRVWVSAGDMSATLEVTVKAVDESEKYPDIYVDYDWDNGIITATTTTVSHTVSSDNIKLRIDGNDVSGYGEKIQYNDYYAGLKYTAESGFFGGVHKVSVEVTNSAGETSIWNGTVGNGSVTSDYSDISGHWAVNTIGIMSAKGIVQGDTVNGVKYFRPNDAMTRAQFAVMMCNYLGINAEDYASKRIDFKDKASIPDWAVNQVKAMSELHIINGKTTENGVIFDPYGNVTRAEAVTILSRIMPDGLYAGNLYFADNDSIPDWSLNGFKRLITSGVMNGYTDNTLKPTNNISRAEALTLLYNIM